MPRTIARFGWIPDAPDNRDHMYSAPVETLAQLPPSVDLRPQCPAVYDQGQLGSCFPPGTRIRMADGSERPIEDVRLGESVVTAEGRLGRVLRTMLRDESSGLVRLILWGHSHLRLTREHPVLTSRGYIAAGELSIGDEVGLPQYAPSEAIAEIAPRSLVRRHRVGSVELPESIRLDEGFGRLVGLWLAEGSADGTKVRWYYGDHEANTLVPETVELIRDALGVEAHAVRRSSGSWWVTLYGTPWNALFKSLGGERVESKRLAPVLCNGFSRFLGAMFDGWMAGDGGSHGGTLEGVTVSKDLALAMYDIAQALGRHPAITRSEPVLNSAAKSRLPRWTLSLAPGAGRCRQDESHVWRKVRELRIEEYEGPVYNLSVEGDESYVAEGIGVHNCTGNAIAGAIEFERMKQRLPDFVPSRLFIYYNERAIEGTVTSDSGAQIRDGIKSVAKQGVCPETEWPYDITKFEVKPPASAFQDALLDRAVSYQRLTHDLNQMKSCLASGFPFVFGFNVYESFESQEVAQTGHAPMPAPGEQEIGGHAVVAVGYEDSQQWFLVRNSWGAGWGMSGYFTLPYAYLTQPALASDFWTIRMVSGLN